MTIDDELSAHVAALRSAVAASSRTIDDLVSTIASCFASGGKLLICGSGGSAADAQHFAAEFMNRMAIEHRPYPAIALTTDSSVLTSIANDSAYEDVFARQVEGLGGRGDVLVAISTSGRSEAVLRALRVGKAIGMTTVGFTGASGDARMRPDCDLVLAVPSDDTPRIQEVHEFVYHHVAGAVERVLAGEAVAESTGMDRSGRQ